MNETTNDTRPDYEIARETLTRRCAELALTVDAVFVPFSLSRNAVRAPKVRDRSLNWKVTIRHAGRPVLDNLDYSAGIGHCPALRGQPFRRMTQDVIDAVVIETEQGVVAKIVSWGAWPTKQKIAPPDPIDVIAAVAQDGAAIDYARYEDWAEDMGIDPDSRKGEAIYRACLTQGLVLRVALGDAVFQELRELAQRL